MKRILKNILRRMAEPMELFYLSIGSFKKCPICGWTGHSFARRFNRHKPEILLKCPACGSFERHRFAYFILKDRLGNYAQRILHFAPEAGIQKWLCSISQKYLSVDLSSPKVMVQMDITNLAFCDNSFSLLWCSHVLEHVEDDRLAMRELFRVLRPFGLAVVMVPIYGERTYEDFAIKLPADRLRHFKQEDHVRLYGKDIRDRLASVGFNVEVLSTSDLLKDNVAKYALEYPSTKEIFLCTKPKAG